MSDTSGIYYFSTQISPVPLRNAPLDMQLWHHTVVPPHWLKGTNRFYWVELIRAYWGEWSKQRALGEGSLFLFLLSGCRNLHEVFRRCPCSWRIEPQRKKPSRREKKKRWMERILAGVDASSSHPHSELHTHPPYSGL